MEYYKVIMSSGIVTHDYVRGLTMEEAADFCEENDWHYLDENRFEWSLDYVEDPFFLRDFTQD